MSPLIDHAASTRGQDLSAAEQHGVHMDRASAGDQETDCEKLAPYERAEGGSAPELQTSVFHHAVSALVDHGERQAEKHAAYTAADPCDEQMIQSTSQSCFQKLSERAAHCAVLKNAASSSVDVNGVCTAATAGTNHDTDGVNGGDDDAVAASASNSAGLVRICVDKVSVMKDIFVKAGPSVTSPVGSTKHGPVMPDTHMHAPISSVPIDASAPQEGYISYHGWQHAVDPTQEDGDAMCSAPVATGGSASISVPDSSGWIAAVASHAAAAQHHDMPAVATGDGVTDPGDSIVHVQSMHMNEPDAAYLANKWSQNTALGEAAAEVDVPEELQWEDLDKAMLAMMQYVLCAYYDVMHEPPPEAPAVCLCRYMLYVCHQAGMLVCHCGNLWQL